jgi:hypothetical protein
MNRRDYAPCEICGHYGITRTKALEHAEEARELIDRLRREYGSIRMAAHAYSARFGVNQTSAERQFYRLTGGHGALYHPTLLDELRTML